MEAETGIGPENTRVFVTGSGGGTLAEMVGAKFVQEVHAVALAVEKLHPEVYSVIELGGQDAKIIVFKDDEETGRKKKIPSMNDKCAGGTGAVIDKINAKLKIPTDELAEQKYHGIKLHKVAGKCGVFAETDINGLQKVGTPPDELMAHDHRHRDRPPRPGVPFVDVQIGATDAGAIDADEYVIDAADGLGHIAEGEAGFGFRFDEGFHGRRKDALVSVMAASG